LSACKGTWCSTNMGGLSRMEPARYALF